MNTCHVCARKYKLDLEFCPHCGAMNLELDSAPKVRKINISLGQSEDKESRTEEVRRPQHTNEENKEQSNRIRRSESKTLDEILAKRKDETKPSAVDNRSGDTKMFSAEDMREISAAQNNEEAEDTSSVEAARVEREEAVKQEAVKPVKPVKPVVVKQAKIEEVKEKPVEAAHVEEEVAEELEEATEEVATPEEITQDAKEEADEIPRSKEDWDIEVSQEEEDESSMVEFFVGLWASIAAGAAVAWTTVKGWAAVAGANIAKWSGIAWTKIKEWSAAAWVKIKEWTNTARENFNTWNEKRKEQAEIRREEREREEAARLEAEQIRLEEEARLRAEEEERAEEVRIRLAEENRIREAEEARLEEERFRQAEALRIQREEEDRIRRQEEEERFRQEEALRLQRAEEDRVRRQEEDRIRLAKEAEARAAEQERRRYEEEQNRIARETRDSERAERDAREQERLRLAKEAYEAELRNSRSSNDNRNYAASSASRDYYQSVDEEQYSNRNNNRSYEDNYDREYSTSSGRDNRVLNNVSWNNEADDYYSSSSRRNRAEVEQEEQYEDYDDDNVSIWRRITSPITNAFEWLFVRLRPIHIVGIVGAIAIAVVVYIWSNSGSPVRNFTRALADRNYEQAGELYSSYEDRDEMLGLANDELETHLDQLLDNAAAGNTSYAATYSALEVINDSELYQGDAQTMLDETLTELGRLQEINIVYDNALSSQNNLDFESAIEGYNRVINSYPNYRDANARLVNSRQQYREQVLRDVNSLQSQGNYSEANSVLDRALELIPEDPVFTNMKENNMAQSDSALYQEASAEAERYFQAGNYEEMFNVIDNAIVIEPDNETLKELRAEYEFQSAEAILNTADSIFIQGDKEGAIERIDLGLELIPNSEMLQDAKERYELDLDEDGDGDGDGDPTDEDGSSLGRNEYRDAAGNVHTDSVLVEHAYTGTTDVVETFRVNNESDGSRFAGEIAIGQVDAYTQVYYQVYSSNNLAAPLYQGSIYANADEAGETYRVQIDANAANAEYFVINLNYLRGSQIQVILDLEFE